MIKVVTFDIVDLPEIIGLGETALIDMTPTPPYADEFETLGYGNRNTVDLLGFVNYVIIGMLVHLI